MRRVVVTGLGAISPIGNDIQTFWQNIVQGVSGAGPITKFDSSKFKTRIACEVKNFNPLDYIEKKELKKYDLFTQYAIVASDQAIKDSGLDFALMEESARYEIGVIWASQNGGIDTFEHELKNYHSGDGTPRFNPYFIPKMIVNIAAGVISIRHQLYGPNYCPTSACASSNTAIINAFDTIRLGKANIIIAGGSEAALTEASVGGFSALQALSKQNDNPLSASKPYDKNRDGFVMAEGAAALILEDLDHALARGAHIYAEVAGGGMAADAYHLTGTHPEGLGAKLGMQKALADAGITPQDITYINAHATSTGIGDIGELQGIYEVFKDTGVAISATKSMTGHLLGAAGAIESIVCTLAIHHDIIPATINTEVLDERIPEGIHLVLGKPIHTQVNYALNNTFGFGGHTACSIFKKYRP